MVFIIDGNHLACRCWFSIQKGGGLKTTYGKQVGLIYLFMSAFRNIIRTYNKNLQTYFLIAWDGGGKTVRHEAYPNYKADRKKFQNDFYEQINDLMDILPVLKIQQFRKETIEADDYIGTLTRIARENRQKVIIYSGDHDFEQLISNSVSVIKASKDGDIIKDLEWFRQEYGLEKPKEILDVMAITGDDSDNISGVPKVQATTAIKLLKANQGLNNILNNPENLKTLNKSGEIVDATEKLKAAVKDNIEAIKRNIPLVTINCNLEAEVCFKREKPDFEELKNIFKKLEFNKYLEKFYQWERDLALEG